MKATTHASKRKYWQEQINESGKFKGTQKAFCTARNLSIHTFRYWKKHLQPRHDQRKALASPFVPVQVERLSVEKPALPDPLWVAELIFHLQSQVSR